MRKWRCVKVAYANELTLGKIYETNDDGYGLVFDNGIKGSYEITKYASVGSEFEEIKEGDEKVRERSIHITTDGTSTHAVLKDGNRVIRRAKVGLYHTDEYKFETGVIEVVKKLFDEETEAHKKFKVGDKVRIVKNISNIKNWNDRMDKYIGKVMTIDNIRHSMVGSRLIYEMKEDKRRWNWEEDYVEDINTVHSYKQLSEYSTDELLDEIKRRMEK